MVKYMEKVEMVVLEVMEVGLEVTARMVLMH